MEQFEIETGLHNDARREITDFVLPADLILPFTLRQIKSVRMHDKSVAEGFVVGNHYHTEESGRCEFFVAMGPDGDLFEARYRDPRGSIETFMMHRGSACLVRPPVSHAFRPLQKGAVLVGLSNLPYDAAHDIPDKLFF